MNLHNLPTHKTVLDLIGMAYGNHEWKEEDGEIYYKYKLDAQAEWTPLFDRHRFDKAFPKWAQDNYPNLEGHEIYERYGVG